MNGDPCGSQSGSTARGEVLLRRVVLFTWRGWTRCSGFCLGMLTRRMGSVLALYLLPARGVATFLGTGGGRVDT